MSLTGVVLLLGLGIVARAPEADAGRVIIDDGQTAGQPRVPILVLTSPANPFTGYYAEILRTEGLNAFAVVEVDRLTAAALDAADVALVGDLPLTAAQAALLVDWVEAGGRLIAMRPDPLLLDFLGLDHDGSTLADAYLKIDTSAPPGAGIIGETIQFHGPADLYVQRDGRAIAALFSGPDQPTPHPAVTVRAVGTAGGRAAAFAYDLARSVVLTRQGNPAWAGQERDGVSPIRPDDMFYGAAAGDPQPDWIDLTKVAIPQADEQQRLLANLILHLNSDRKPLPRFWYFPRGHKAIVIMTGDDHASGGTAGRFDKYLASSPAGCSVEDWECVRGSSYIYPSTPNMDDARAAFYTAAGFEVGLHVNTGCADWTPESLDSFYTDQLAAWAANHPSIPAPSTNRTHCIVWSEFATQARIELRHGIRLDTNYYYWPPAWVSDRPGFFTGSGMPMRFADLDGTLIDVYQATTQMTDESGQSYPFTIDTLLDRALGPLGYYGAFTANMHTDSVSSAGSDAIVASALARGVPVVSGRQMLEWLDARNGSAFHSVSWTRDTLSFTIAVAEGVRGIQVLLPSAARTGALTALRRDGAQVPYRVEVIKGIEYALFEAHDGVHEAWYAPDTTPPVISGVSVAPGSDGTADVAWLTDERSDSRIDYGEDAGDLAATAGDDALVVTHGLRLEALQASTTYHYRVFSADASGNRSAWPPPGDPPATFATPAASFIDTTAADFLGGVRTATYVGDAAGGEVLLAPAEGAEFFGSTLPEGWSSTLWSSSGVARLADGVLTLDGARAGTSATYGPGRAVEFRAVFTGAANQHIGFGQTFNEVGWAIFSTGGGSGFFARSSTAGQSLDTPLPVPSSGPHLYRIQWAAGGVAYFIDGGQVASHTIAIAESLRPLASDFVAGDGGLTVDFIRMTPYAASGGFESRIFDAGGPAEWEEAGLTLDQPSGTSVTFETRSGDTPVPDGSWSAFAPAGPGIGSPPARYLQYRLGMTTASPSVTPTIHEVRLGYAPSCSPTPEVCDGRDNDCDGAIDEDALLLCDDGNPCTDDACDPAAGCVNRPNTLEEDFTGSSLPPGWGGFTWSAGGSLTVASGSVSLDAAALRTDALYDAGRAVQFVATFQAEPYQHAGFAGGGDTAPQIFGTAPWAIFSTGGDGNSLLARTWDGVSVLDEPVPGSWLGTRHAYRIDWRPEGVIFYIDGLAVSVHPVRLSGGMRVAASDLQEGGVPLVVEWARIAATCEDGDACTSGDLCLDGACAGGTPAVPGEAARDLQFVDFQTVAWTASPDAASYNFYRGSADGGSWVYDHVCLQAALTTTVAQDPSIPEPASALYYLVSSRNQCGEGHLGTTSGGTFRPNLSPCP